MTDIDGESLLASWTRSLRARNRSQGTIDAYLTDARRLVEHLAGHDVNITSARRRHVEDYLATCVEQGLAPATVGRRYRTFVQLFRWLDQEDELDGDNPMAKMSPPKQPVIPPPVINDEDMAALLAACERPRVRPGRAAPSKPGQALFENRRDAAIVRLLSTTGVRSAELMGLSTTDIDLNHGTFTVLGKGARPRIVRARAVGR